MPGVLRACRMAHIRASHGRQAGLQAACAPSRITCPIIMSGCVTFTPCMGVGQGRHPARPPHDPAPPAHPAAAAAGQQRRATRSTPIGPGPTGCTRTAHLRGMMMPPCLAATNDVSSRLQTSHSLHASRRRSTPCAAHRRGVGPACPHATCCPAPTHKGSGPPMSVVLRWPSLPLDKMPAQQPRWRRAVVAQGPRAGGSGLWRQAAAGLPRRRGRG